MFRKIGDKLGDIHLNSVHLHYMTIPLQKYIELLRTALQNDVGAKR